MNKNLTLQFVSDKATATSNLCVLNGNRFIVEAKENGIDIKPLTNPELFNLCHEILPGTLYPHNNSNGDKYCDLEFYIENGIVKYKKVYKNH